jgi:predicted flavoprotein YhiN
LKITIIGGGAAGFFAALSAKTHYPDAHVCILEKTSKFLGKVKISGGGRCNVTNATFNNRLLSENYPRGEKFLRKAFERTRYCQLVRIERRCAENIPRQLHISFV